MDKPAAAAFSQRWNPKKWHCDQWSISWWINLWLISSLAFGSLPAATRNDFVQSAAAGHCPMFFFSFLPDHRMYKELIRKRKKEWLGSPFSLFLSFYWWRTDVKDSSPSITKRKNRFAEREKSVSRRLVVPGRATQIQRQIDARPVPACRLPPSR